MLELPWVSGEHQLPVWIAGYGPVALKLTGRIADGAMLQIGDPDLIRWFVSQVRASAEAAGRDPMPVKVMAAAPAHVGDLADGRDRTRWFPALVSNHVVDLVNKYPREDLPEELTDLRPRPRGLRLPPPRRGGLVERVVRVGRDRRPVLPRGLGRGRTSRGSASWPTPAWTSSTST